MRYDTFAYFQSITEGAYDASTGDYADPEIVEDKVLCSHPVSASERVLQHVFGEVRKRALIIHTQNAYRKPFSRIRIGTKVYQATTTSYLRSKGGYVLTEEV